jgi:hypothetical protein
MAFSGGSSTFPDFESHGGRLEAFDDGHIPETFRWCAQSTTEEDEDVPRIVRYNHAADKNDVHIYNDVLHPHHARMLYEATAPPKQLDDISDRSLKLTGESPWGTYVTVEEALNWINWNETNRISSIKTTAQQTYEDYLATWKETLVEFYMWQQQQQHKSTASSDEKKEDDNDFIKIIEDMDTIRHGLAVEAVAKFFLETIPSSPGHFVATSPEHSNQTPKKELLYTKRDFITQAHGVAVWALSSRPGCSVQYHIDYAELLRYEYNVTVPPLWAGTAQCSPLNDHNKNNMEGGEFCVNLDGLQHYAEHGYKGAISQDSMGGWRSPATSNNTISGGAPHIDSSNKWITIPYALNRGIVHNGDLPHLSAPVKLINDDHVSRVIVGFNVFGHDVGSLVQMAPEHSKPFRRKVKLYRSAALNVSATQNNDGKSGTKGCVDLSRIRKNKALTKLLVLAKREKVKEQLRHDQNQLTRNIWNMLLQHHGSNENRYHLCVGDVVKELGVPSVVSGWPTVNDAHVHLHNMLCRQNSEGSTKKYHDVVGIAGIPGAHYTMSVVDDLESSSTQTNDVESSRCHLVSTSAAISIIAVS